jgi:cytochrome b
MTSALQAAEAQLRASGFGPSWKAILEYLGHERRGHRRGWAGRRPVGLAGLFAFLGAVAVLNAIGGLVVRRLLHERPSRQGRLDSDALPVLGCIVLATSPYRREP